MHSLIWPTGTAQVPRSQSLDLRTGTLKPMPDVTITLSVHVHVQSIGWTQHTPAG